MRERSKNAARTRREKENHEFSELARLLPHPSSSTANMDKATVVKLTTAYLKLRNIFPYGIGTPWGSQTQDTFLKEHAAFLVKSLEGFLIIIGPNLKTIYVSEGVSFYLGLSQTEMMGNSIMDYIHLGDHEELKSLLRHEEKVLLEDRIHEEIEVARCFSLRMKCTLTKRCAGLVRDSYKVILFRGYLKMAPKCLPSRGTNNLGEARYHAVGFVAAGNAIHPTTSLELKMHSNTFMCRAELDLKFVHVEERIKELTGYDPQHLRHKSLYKFVHVCDSFKLNEDHTQLLRKGQAVSSYYRFLTQNGGWIWIQSSFIMLLNSKSRHSFILAINHVLSEPEYKEYLLEEEQVTKQTTLECDESGRPVYIKNSVVPENVKAPSKVKKKSLPDNRIKNTCTDQYVSVSAYVQSSTTAAPFANNFLPIPCIQPENIAVVSPLDSQPISCIQPTNPAISIASDLMSIAQNNSSHASAPLNNVRGCLYSGENMNSYPPLPVVSYTQTSNNSICNSTEYYNTFPTNSSLDYFGCINDPFFNFSMYHNKNLTPHTEVSAAYSEYYHRTAKRSCIKKGENDSSFNEQLPYYVDPIVQESVNSAQRSHESFQNLQVASSPDSSKRNEPSCTDIYSNDVPASTEQQPFYTEPTAASNPLNYGLKYEQIPNFEIVPSPTSPQRHFNNMPNTRNSPCGEQPYYGEQVLNLQLASPVDTECNETYSNPSTVNLLPRSDTFTENSMDNLEHIPRFAVSDLNSKIEILPTNVDEPLQLPHCVSANLCSTKESRDQMESMHFDSYSYSDKLICVEATVQPVESLNTSPDINENWSLNNFNNASASLDSLEARNGNVSNISKTHLDEFSPVSANSLSSDPNTERSYFCLNSSSDYSNGYSEEPEKELARLNYDGSFNPVTNYRKDFLDFSSFENRTSSTPLYTTL